MPWNWARGWEQALTLFLRQALEGSLHHVVTGPSLAPPQKKGAVFDPDSFLLPETFQHPVVKFTSFLWERRHKLRRVIKTEGATAETGTYTCGKLDLGSDSISIQAQCQVRGGKGQAHRMRRAHDGESPS